MFRTVPQVFPSSITSLHKCVPIHQRGYPIAGTCPSHRSTNTQKSVTSLGFSGGRHILPYDVFPRLIVSPLVLTFEADIRLCRLQAIMSILGMFKTKGTAKAPRLFNSAATKYSPALSQAYCEQHLPYEHHLSAIERVFGERRASKNFLFTSTYNSNNFITLSTN